MIRRQAALALLLGALAAPANADSDSEAMLRDFLSGIDASPDWSATTGRILSEGDDTVAEGIVLTRGEPRISISIERLRLSDLEAGDGGGFSASDIEMTGATLASDLVDYAIPSATVSDISMPAADVGGFDTRHMMTFIAEIYSAAARAEFTEFAIPEMTGTQRQPAAGDAAGEITSRFVYRNLVSSGLADGVLGSSSAGPINITVDAPETETFEMQIASAAGERIDLAAVARIFDEREYRDGRGDAIWRPLVSRIGYSGFTGKGADGVSFRLNEVAIESMDGRQPEKPFTQAFDRLLDPVVPESTKGELALDAIRDLYAAWRVGTVRMEGFSVDAPAEQTTFSLASFSLTGLSNEGIDSVILKEMRAESPSGFGSLDAFQMAGLVFPDVKALMQFAALEDDASAAAHEKTIRETFAALPRLAHFGLRGLAAGLSRDDAVTLGGFALDLRDWNEIYAGSTDMRIEELYVPRSLMQLDEQTSGVMDTLGFDRLVFGMSLADRWSPEAGTDEATWTMTLLNAADLELSYRIGGLTRDWMFAAISAAGKGEDSQAAVAAMLPNLKLERATLKVTDRSLLDRAFAVAAEKQNLDIDGPAYREQMRVALPFLISAALEADLSKLLSSPLQLFMSGGQTLTVEAAPAEPVPIMELMEQQSTDPAALVQRLGVTLSSEPASAP